MQVEKSRRAVKRSTAGTAAKGTRAKAPEEILMLEDSATDVELAIRAFRRAHIANPLKVIPSAEAALDYLRGTGAFAKNGPARPMLILLDLQLTGMSGLDFLSQIKVDEHVWDIPVVTLSFTDSAPAIVMCLQRGVAGHLIKPIIWADLARITRTLNLALIRDRPSTPPAGNTP
jgi:CheY-like chemotaxis protein